MAISRNLNNRNKTRSPILLISVSAAAITFLFIFYSSSSSLLEFSFSSPKAQKNLLRDRKQRHSLDKYLYWGDRIHCPGKHCDSYEGLGHQESSLRCALEEALFLQRNKGVANVEGGDTVDLKESNVCSNLLLINCTASPLSWFMECKDRNSHSAIKFPYSFLHLMAAKKLRDVADQVKGLLGDYDAIHVR